jgi:hypothetical protein
VTRRRLAWGLWGATMLLLVLAVAVGTQKPDNFRGGGAIAVMTSTMLFLLVFASVGLVVALRRPGSPIGWLLAAGGLVTGVATVVTIYADYAFHVKHGHAAGFVVSAWLVSWIWSLGIAPGAILAPLFFPDGKLLSPRWKPVLWIGAAGIALVCIGPALQPGPIPDYHVLNPVGIDGAEDALRAITTIGGACIGITFLAVVVSLVVRYRRSHGVERQQLKWLAYSVALIAAGSVVSGWVEPRSVDTSNAIESFTLISYPIALGVAMLRYRLYDIDVVINRTLVYGLLTAMLAGVYVGSVLLLQLALDSVTSDSSLAVAVSTLGVAALFRPARSRIQAAVDRRFYRRKYDATRTLELFSARLREQVDLDALGGELRGVVAETMQPAHVSLWLRRADR